MANVFISYAHNDAQFVRDQMLPALEQLGYTVWVDLESIPGSVEWRSAITQGIQNAAVGTTRINPATKVVEIADVEHFAAECVNPPPGVKAEEWITQGFPGAKCK